MFADPVITLWWPSRVLYLIHLYTYSIDTYTMQPRGVPCTYVEELCEASPRDVSIQYM